jgi:DNA polymerase-3 subunit gamma/tau
MEAPYLALYRRYRPQVFAEVVGQEAIVASLRAAVSSGRVAHAYLFSGPRGTGKTSSARILAKALNCDAVADGEPCGVCPSCVAIADGTSLDVVELDAASNNGVDAVRELIGRVALGSPGHRRVFILDEVHMLSQAASNALLKTLEEPPAGVVFVLATTDPHKVPPTIRSRVQHFEFRLLGTSELAAQVRRVADAAGLAASDDVVAEAVRLGAGSVRDALSALERLSLVPEGRSDEAPGGSQTTPALDRLVDALGAGDAPGALVAWAEAAQMGLEPARVISEVVERLRQAFLVSFSPELAQAWGERAAAAERWARALGLPEVTGALERFGRAGVVMRDLPEPAVALELALVETARSVARRHGEPGPTQHEGPVQAAADQAAPAADLGRLQAQLAALEARVGALERRERGAALSPEGASPTRRSPLGATPALGALRRSREAEVPEERDSAPSPPSAPDLASTTSPGPLVVELDELWRCWTTEIFPSLAPSLGARLAEARPIEVDARRRRVVFGVPSDGYRRRCERLRPSIAEVLAARFGAPILVELRVSEGARETLGEATAGGEATSEPAGDEPEATEDLAALVSHHVQDAIGVDEYIRQRFPGVEEV